MILKYYNDGWCWVDKMEDPKWININLLTLFSDAYKSVDAFKFELPSEDADIKAYVYRDGGTWDEIEPQHAFSDLLAPVLASTFRKSGEPHVYYDMCLSNYDIKELFKLYKNAETKSLLKGNLEYTRVVFYTREGERRAKIFTATGYLCNDNGQTIEKIGF